MARHVSTEVDKHRGSFEPRLIYFLSEISEALLIVDEQEIALSLKRAFQTCETLHLSLQQNFKKVFRHDGTHLRVDWKISSLACYLLIINCDPKNEHVAKAQLYFALARARDKKPN